MVSDRFTLANPFFPQDFPRVYPQKIWFSNESFRRACWVIEDYCLTGGENIDGGTGLK